MKRIFKTVIFISVCLFGHIANAQQTPLYSQFYFNKFMYNPAMAGENEVTDWNLFGRKQYSKTNGFNTGGLAVQGLIGESKVGLGLSLVSDGNLLQTRQTAYGNYAYHIPLGNENKLSLGFALGVINNRFNTNNFITTDPNDPNLALLNSRPGAIVDAAFGANFKSNGFQLGFSVPQFLSNSQDFTDHQQTNVKYDMLNHFNLITSYDIWVNDNLKIQPLLLYRRAKNAPGQFDFNVMADWMKKGWLGAAIRQGYGVSAMGGLKIAEKVRFGYSYDWSTGQYSSALGGTHEVLVGSSLDYGNSSGNEDKKLAEIQKKMADEQAQKDKEQELRIKELESKVAEVGNKTAKRDTVYVVEKNQNSAKTTETTTTKTSSSGSNTTKTTTSTPTPSTNTTPATEGSDNSGTRTPGEFIVVAGAFSTESNATIYFNQLVNKGYSPYMHYNKENGTYYVHLGKYYFKEEAAEYARNNSKNNVKLWVKTLK